MKPAQGKDLKLSIQMEGSPRSVYPGDVVRGTLTVQTQKSIQVKGIGTALIYQERYKSMEPTPNLHVSSFRHDPGDDERSEYYDSHIDEYWTGGAMVIGEGMLPAYLGQTYPFELRIPDNAPPPYLGEVAPVYWLIRPTAFLPTGNVGFQDIALPLVVPHSGQALIAENPEPKIHPNSENLTIRFELPRFEYAEGETITGTLVTEPDKDISARAILVGLEWYESGLAGSSPVSKTLKDPLIQIAGKTQLRCGVPAAFNFSLPIPVRSRPTRRSDKSTSIFRIRASIDIPWRADDEASTEIFLSNGRR
ncbi:MAG: hypothetical protein ABIP75_15560 [Pyrinomonadaceae bacterium]